MKLEGAILGIVFLVCPSLVVPDLYQDCECSLLKRLLKFETELEDVQAKLKSGEYPNFPPKSPGGATYIRWGRNTCPGNGTDIVYAGFAGGSLFSDRGAPVNRLCLPKDPEWDKYDDTMTSGAKLCGGEYQFDAHKDKSSALFGKNIHDQDAVCSVCVSHRQAVVMVPGRMTCHAGWTKEYHGYLFAGYNGHNAATEYACIDRDPEYQTGGSAQKYGNIWYFVEAVCGSLPCPPYVNGREITCVVCTK